MSLRALASARAFLWLELMVFCPDEELSIPLPQCAFEAKCLQFLIAHLSNNRSGCLIVRLRHIASYSSSRI
jgi:hypothetical protein